MRLFLSTGELSGDYHAAHLLREIARQASERGIPLEVAAIGSTHLRPLVDELWYDSTTWAGIGIIESLRRGPMVALVFQQLKRRLPAWKPDLVIAVDYRVFNLRLLRLAKESGAKTAYYFPPVHWGGTKSKARDLMVKAVDSGKSRRRYDRFDQVAAVTDRVLLTYPISEDNYERAGAEFTYIGHPLANALESELTQSREAVRSEWKLGDDDLLVGIFPGSRDQEIRDLLPILMPAAARLAQEFPRAHFFVSVSHPRYRPAIERAHARLPEAIRGRVRLIEGADPNLLRASDLLLMKSGTSAQTALLLGIPMVTFYRINLPPLLGPLLIAASRNLFINLPYWTFPNLLADRAIVPELIQDDFTVDSVVDAAGRLLRDPDARETQRQELLALRERLYRPDAITRAATICLDLLAPDTAHGG